jgi:hypothetical protein
MPKELQSEPERQKAKYSEGTNKEARRLHPLVKCRKQDLARETALSSGLGEVNFARVRDKQTGQQEGVP